MTARHQTRFVLATQGPGLYEFTGEVVRWVAGSGVETGLLGGLVFLGWSLSLLRGVLRRHPWLGAAFAAVLVLGLQTDVIGVPWIAVVVWATAGDSV